MKTLILVILLIIYSFVIGFLLSREAKMKAEIQSCENRLEERLYEVQCSVAHKKVIYYLTIRGRNISEDALFVLIEQAPGFMRKGIWKMEVN